MKKIYCDFKWKNNLTTKFIKTWKKGEGWHTYDEDKSILGYFILILYFPFAILLTIFEMLIKFLFSIKVKRNK